MAEYYGNCHICLAANGKASPEGGLLSQTNAPIRISGTGPDDLPYCVFLRPRISHLPNGDFANVSSAFPLVQRGWCYQERRLAARVLDFGSHKMSFECSVADRCECEMMGDLTGWTKSSELPTFTLTDEQKAGYVPDEWRKIVVSYSPLDLTRQTDKLVALSGLAKTHGQRRDRTLETIWKCGEKVEGKIYTFQWNGLEQDFWPDFDLTTDSDYASILNEPIYLAAVIESQRGPVFFGGSCVDSLVLRTEDPAGVMEGLPVFSRIGRTYTRLLCDHPEPEKRDDGMTYTPGLSKRMHLVII